MFNKDNAKTFPLIPFRRRVSSQLAFLISKVTGKEESQDLKTNESPEETGIAQNRSDDRDAIARIVP